MKQRQWVIIRGLGREGEHSAEFLEKLRAADSQADVRCIDLPGAGEHFKLSSPMSIEAIAEFVQMHLKNDPRDERFIISISLGAMVTAALLEAYPRIARGAVFTNVSFSNLSPVYHRLQLEGFRHLFRAVTAANSEDRERAVLEMVSNRPDRHDFIQDWAAIASERPVSAMNFFKQLFAAATFKLSERKPDIPLLVLASAGDRMVKPESSQAFSKYWGLPIKTHPTAGHELWLDDADWVIENVLNFFQIKKA